MLNICESEKQLVTRLTNSDEQAFRQIYVNYKFKIFTFSIKILKNRELAEDLVQDVFTYLWESRCFINPDNNFSSYLFTISKNRILNILKRMNVERNYIDKIFEAKGTFFDFADVNLIDSEYRLLFEQAIETLPPTRKKVFKLSRVQYMTHKEIATELDISVYTVQEHISESLKIIKQYLSIRTDINFGIALTVLWIF